MKIQVDWHPRSLNSKAKHAGGSPSIAALIDYDHALFPKSPQGAKTPFRWRRQHGHVVRLFPSPFVASVTHQPIYLWCRMVCITQKQQFLMVL
jgi:hypothetical protein